MSVNVSPVISQSTSPLENPDVLEPISLSESELSSEPESQSSSSSKSIDLSQEIQIFFSTFITIFLAELGDKTQVTTLLMSAESQSPWIVFAGAGSALLATSLIGVSLGHWLSKRVSQRTLEVSAAVLLLIISALLLWDVVHA